MIASSATDRSSSKPEANVDPLDNVARQMKDMSVEERIGFAIRLGSTKMVREERRQQKLLQTQASRDMIPFPYPNIELSSIAGHKEVDHARRISPGLGSGKVGDLTRDFQRSRRISEFASQDPVLDPTAEPIGGSEKKEGKQRLAVHRYKDMLNM
jgi:hypothetical protein